MACIKPSYNTERILLGERLPLEAPFSIILDTSSRCNFKCSYCYRSGKKDENWGYAADNKNMDIGTFNLVVKQLKEFPRKLKSVSLSGHGEPLCNPWLADMARQLEESGTTENIEMHTNASLLTELNIKDIASAGFTRIVISVQGLDADTYDRVCGVKIDWGRFYNNLKLLYENKSEKLTIHVKITDVALGQDKYRENEGKFYNLFECVADFIFVEKTVPLWRNVDVGQDAGTTKFGNDFSYVKYCPLLFYKMMVAPDGTIYPCTGLPPPISIGNVVNMTLFEAWNSSKRQNFLKEHLRLSRHSHGFCNGCFVPANSIMSHEDVIDPYKDAILGRLEGQLDVKRKN